MDFGKKDPTSHTKERPGDKESRKKAMGKDPGLLRIGYTSQKISLENTRSKRWNRILCLWRKRLPFELWLNNGLPLDPYIRGHLITFLRNKLRPRDICLPPDQVYFSTEQMDCKEYTQIRGWMVLWLDYLKWYSRQALSEWVTFEQLMNAPVITSHWRIKRRWVVHWLDYVRWYWVVAKNPEVTLEEIVNPPVVTRQWKIKQTNENLIHFGQLMKCFDEVGKLEIYFSKNLRKKKKRSCIRNHLFDGFGFIALKRRSGSSLVARSRVFRARRRPSAHVAGPSVVLVHVAGPSVVLAHVAGHFLHNNALPPPILRIRLVPPKLPSPIKRATEATKRGGVFDYLWPRISRRHCGRWLRSAFSLQIGVEQVAAASFQERLRDPDRWSRISSSAWQQAAAFDVLPLFEAGQVAAALFGNDSVWSEATAGG
ncbi:hypothetical protein AXF42_Ash007980 [Apostasia shenzhenica]|uniref:Uncharacterized protein n=1 Tax=Apostasia shenzhenica TaxID=1088818 RepID=A0A2I0B5W2_9ASPA|nr:hypothetical protein AXF42_Ash007980 [Apostasia shenzhenica]